MLVVAGIDAARKIEAARAAIDAIARVDERFRQAIVQPVDVADVELDSCFQTAGNCEFPKRIARQKREIRSKNADRPQISPS